MREQRFNNLVIQTPEGVTFAYRLAGPMQRLFALLLDKLVILGLTLGVILISALIAWPLGMLTAFAGDMVKAVATAGFFVISTGYGIYTEWKWDGQTVGKRAVGLRVMDARGLELDFFQIVMRNLLRVVDSSVISFPIGGIVVFFSRYHQRVGDLAGNTIVVQLPKDLKPDLDTLMADKYNSFREVPHLAARLRQQIGPQEAAIALRALTRRDRLEDSARADLFREIADHFRGLVRFPEECILGLSDEKYVQNVVDVVYRDKKGQKNVKA